MTTQDEVDLFAMGEFLPKLKVADRCDRCGAQAWVRIRFGRGGWLDLCAHHFAKHEPALRYPVVIAIRDQRDELAIVAQPVHARAPEPDPA